MAVALRRCPSAVVVKPRFERYLEASRRVFAIFRDFTPLVEPLSIDEAFLDVTGTERLNGSAVVVGHTIRSRIRSEVSLTASVGVAPNKFLAKLASDLDKPDGLTVVTKETAPTLLAPLPIERMWGVGPVTAKRMHAHRIRTFADLARRDPDELERIFGSAGPHYRRLARGLDDRAVQPEGEAKSVSHETTFEEDLASPEEVRGVLLHLTEDVGRRLRRRGLTARTVFVKIRYGDFETITRSLTLDGATALTHEIWEAARGLFDAWAATSFKPVRLIGVGTSHFAGGGGQLPLFPEPGRERQKRLDRAVDRIRDRFGREAIQRRPREGGPSDAEDTG
jgi:DNA polymerase-4